MLCTDVPNMDECTCCSNNHHKSIIQLMSANMNFTCFKGTLRSSHHSVQQTNTDPSFEVSSSLHQIYNTKGHPTTDGLQWGKYRRGEKSSTFALFYEKFTSNIRAFPTPSNRLDSSLLKRMGLNILKSGSSAGYFCFANHKGTMYTFSVPERHSKTNVFHQRQRSLKSPLSLETDVNNLPTSQLL